MKYIYVCKNIGDHFFNIKVLYSSLHLEGYPIYPLIAFRCYIHLGQIYLYPLNHAILIIGLLQSATEDYIVHSHCIC